MNLELHPRDALQAQVGENLEADAGARDLLKRGRHALGNRIDDIGTHGLAHIDLKDVRRHEAECQMLMHNTCHMKTTQPRQRTSM